MAKAEALPRMDPSAWLALISASGRTWIFENARTQAKKSTHDTLH